MLCFLCLLLMYYFCEKCYYNIVLYIANCVSWVPWLNLDKFVGLTNKLNLQMCKDGKIPHLSDGKSEA